MKAIKIFAVLIIIIVFTYNKAQAQDYQADVIYDGGKWQILQYSNYGPYDAIEAHALPTPSGNGIIAVVFQLDMSDPRVPENGINKMASIAHYFYNGRLFEILDGEMIITADGKSKAVYHVNGQQEPIVLKDDGCIPYTPCTGEEICGRATKEIRYWNNNFHMNFYGAYIGSTSSFHYSITGIYNERIQFPGEKIITVPLQVKMEDHVIAVFYIDYKVKIDITGKVELDDAPGGTGECK